MEENPRISIRMDGYGRWLPPRRIYGSRIRSGGTTGKFYYFNGTRVAEADDVPSSAVLYKTASIYHEGDILWMIPYDATRYRVGAYSLAHSILLHWHQHYPMTSASIRSKSPPDEKMLASIRRRAEEGWWTEIRRMYCTHVAPLTLQFRKRTSNRGGTIFRRRLRRRRRRRR
jgi:hypothetical protein